MHSKAVIFGSYTTAIACSLLPSGQLDGHHNLFGVCLHHSPDRAGVRSTVKEGLDMTKHDPVFLEDLVVGAEYHSAEHRLDTEQITDFARQFDPQPFHLDGKAAEGSLLQGLAASGWHTAAITMKLLV